MGPIPEDKKAPADQEEQDQSQASSSSNTRGQKRPEFFPVLTRSLAKKLKKTASLPDLSVYPVSKVKKRSRKISYKTSKAQRDVQSKAGVDTKVQSITVALSEAQISEGFKRNRSHSAPYNFLSLFIHQESSFSTQKDETSISPSSVKMTNKVEIKIKVPDLDENNFETWKGKMMWQLQLYGLSEMVAKAHDDKAKKADGYAADNLKACIAMKNKMTQKFIQKVDHFKTAHEIWNFVIVYFEGNEKTKMAKFFEDLIDIKTDFTDASDLVGVLTKLRESIEKSTLILDEVIRYFLLRALPEPFDGVKVVIENSQSTLEENFQSVLKAERRMKQESSKSILAAQAAKNQHPQVTVPKKEFPPCEHCNRLGHPPWRCRDRPRTSKNTNDQQNSSQTDSKSSDNTKTQPETRKSNVNWFGTTSFESSGSEESDSEVSRIGCMANKR